MRMREFIRESVILEVGVEFGVRGPFVQAVKMGGLPGAREALFSREAFIQGLTVTPIQG